MITLFIVILFSPSVFCLSFRLSIYYNNKKAVYAPMDDDCPCLTINLFNFRILRESSKTYQEVEHELSWRLLKLKNFSSKIFAYAMKYPPFAYLVNLIGNWTHLTKDVILHVLQDYHVRRLLDSFLAKTNFYIATTFKALDLMANKREIFSYTLEYAPERGYIRHEQYLPIQWYEFTEVPQMIELFSASPDSGVDINAFYFNLMDALRSFSAAWESQTLLPPFSATGMLIGNNHVITFDGKIYDFEGNCRYILTRDFGHNRFSIISNYKRKERTSLSILSDGHEIELFKDGRVYLDKKRIELPKMINNSYVKQAGNRIVLYNKQGFIVDCNTVHNICSVKLSGWYFGRTGGLFGVYDNEPSNDWMLSNRQVTEDISQFAGSWQVGDRCNSDYTPVSESKVRWDIKKCTNLFLSEESIFRPCFGVVDPKPYYSICLKEMEMQGNSGVVSSGFCQASAGYAENCKLNKVSINVPLDCVQCEAPTRPFLLGGHNIRYPQVSALQRRADIVFVVDQKKCVENIDLDTISRLVESSLKEDNFVSNRYALVGYGGINELVDPHIFTSSSKIFTDSNGIRTAFDG